MMYPRSLQGLAFTSAVLPSLLLAACNKDGDTGAEVSDPFAIHEDVQLAAEDGLSIVQANINTSNYSSFGLESAEQASDLTLGTPAWVAYMQIEKLAEHSGTEFGTLLHNGGELIYPLELDGEVATGLTVHFNEDRWEMLNFGGSAEIQALEALRRDVVDGGYVPLRESFVVRIPAMYVLLVGQFTGAGDIALASVWDHPELGLSAGQTVAASELFPTLIEQAKGHESAAPAPEEGE